MSAHVNFDQIGESDQPSPSIWKDCPKGELNELGLGIYEDVTFRGHPTGTLAAALDVNMVSFGGLMLDADTDTVLAKDADQRGGALNIETDGDDNDAAALFSHPFGRIVKNSGQKLWLEAIVAVGDTDADLGVFVGLAEADAIDGTTTTARDVLSDDVASNAVVAESVIGFILDNGNDDAFDVIVKKDGGTAFNPFTDVTNSAAITAAGGTVGAVADATYRKLGIKFDGQKTISFYVDGYLIGTDEIDSTYDQAKDVGVVVGIKTGAAAAEQLEVKRVRYAFKER